MFEGYKTYIAAIAAFGIAVCTVAAQWANGESMDVELIISALVALAMIFLRKGITNEAQKINSVPDYKATQKPK